jgi:hypothetical protein
MMNCHEKKISKCFYSLFKPTSNLLCKATYLTVFTYHIKMIDQKAIKINNID